MDWKWTANVAHYEMEKVVWRRRAGGRIWHIMVTAFRWYRVRIWLTACHLERKHQWYFEEFVQSSLLHLLWPQRALRMIRVAVWKNDDFGECERYEEVQVGIQCQGRISCWALDLRRVLFIRAPSGDDDLVVFKVAAKSSRNHLSNGEKIDYCWQCVKTIAQSDASG